jgi:hypothetical protein
MPEGLLPKAALWSGARAQTETHLDPDSAIRLLTPSQIEGSPRINSLDNASVIGGACRARSAGRPPRVPCPSAPRRPLKRGSFEEWRKSATSQKSFSHAGH